MDAIAKVKRRSRYKRQSTGKRVTPGARETVWFHKLWQHGPLPTTYLYEFTRDITLSKDAVKHRLTDLFHEKNTPNGGEYIWRPTEQWRAPKELEEVHENDTPAEEFLKERGLIPHTSFPSKKTNYQHRLMAACITASIELGCRDAGLTFLPSEMLLQRAPTGELKVPLTIWHQGHTSETPLLSDGYFGLQFPDQRARVFLLEADRASEPIVRHNLDQTSYLRKILQYRQLIENGAYKKHFGVNAGMMVLTVTTSYRHMESIIALVMELTEGRGSTYLLFKVCPNFADGLTVPSVMSELLTTPWRRAGHPEIIISQP